MTTATLRNSSRWSTPAGFVVTLIVLAIGTVLTFRILNPGWVAYRQGIHAASRGDDAAAEALFNKASEAGVPSINMELQLARLRMQKHEFAAAEKSLDIVLKVDPANLEATKMLAGIYQQRGQVALALHAYLDAIDHGALMDATAQLHLAGLYRQAKSYADAKRIYRQLMAGEELADDATFELAQSLAWQRRYPEAIGMLQDLLAEHSDDRKTRLELARVLSWAGRTDESVAEYQKILQK